MDFRLYYFILHFLYGYYVDYLQPDDVVDASSSKQLVDPGHLDRFLLPPDRRRPQSNLIQPISDPQEPRAALPGPGDGGKESGSRVEGNQDDGKTVAADDDESAGYSSGPDDDDDDDDENDENAE